MSRLINETGNVYHWLTVMRRVYKSDISPLNKRAFWLCKCKCGNEITVDSLNLRRKTYKSCGCYGGKDPNRHKKVIEPKKTNIDISIAVNLFILLACIFVIIYMFWV